MNKYLIFRTDRIGDFLLTIILIRSIKRSDSKSYIKVVASKKNFDYIKSFKNIDEVIELKNNTISKIKISIQLYKDNYKAVIIHDGKNRSKFISLFLKTKQKIIVNSKRLIAQIDKIKYVLGKLNYQFEKEDLNTLSGRQYEQKFNLPNNYVSFHFDEKWIFNDYIKSYQKIEPTENELYSFLHTLVNKLNKNIIITTGVNTPKLLSKIFSKGIHPKIKLIDNLNFIETEKIIVNSELLISCHGAVSHVCAAKNIKQIDIIDKSYDYSLWTKHFRNYHSITRSSFVELSKAIIDCL